jgi:hypothetical protein
VCLNAEAVALKWRTIGARVKLVRVGRRWFQGSERVTTSQTWQDPTKALRPDSSGWRGCVDVSSGYGLEGERPPSDRK